MRVSSADLVIVQSSININYVNNKFYDYYNQFYSPANILEIRSARYEYNYNLVNNAYSKIYYQEFINQENKIELQNWNSKIASYIETIKNVDWSQQSDYAVKVREYILSIYNFSNIKDELILLKAIIKEIDRLKGTYPGTFHKTDRYTEILLAISELRDCKSNEISNISYKYGLF